MSQSPASDAGDLVRYLSEQARRFRTNFYQAMATGDPKAVHNLRVASRRLAEVLDLMTRCTDAKGVGRVQRSLKRTRRSFRKVRDLDVLCASVRDDSGPSIADADLRGRVEAILKARREAAAARAARKFEQRPKLASDFSALDELCEAFATFATEHTSILEEHLWEMLHAHAAALLKERPDTEGVDLHKVRIQVKRVRYCAQLLKESGGLPSTDLMEVLTSIQRILGGWCDDFVATRTLSRFAGRWAVMSRQTDFSAEVLEYAAQRARAATEKRSRALELWPALVAAIKASVPGLEQGEAPNVESPVESEAPAPVKGGSQDE